MYLCMGILFSLWIFTPPKKKKRIKFDGVNLYNDSVITNCFTHKHNISEETSKIYLEYY